MAVVNQDSKKISTLEGNSKVIGSYESYINNISIFFNSSELSDVTLKVGTKRFYAHKFLLAANSDVFRAMFSNSAWMESKQREVSLEEKEDCSEVFGDFLKFLYSGRIAVNNDNLVALYKLADKYSVKGLHVSCEQFISERIEATDFSAALSWLSFAEEYQLQSIVQRLYDVLRIHFQKVISSPLWVSVELRQICQLLNSWNIVVDDEYTVYQAVLKWINAEIRRKGKTKPPETVYEPLKYIRPAYLTPDQLLAMEKASGSLIAEYRQSIHTLLFDGYRYHTLRLLDKYSTEFASVQYQPRLYTNSTYSTAQNMSNDSSLNYSLSTGCKQPSESGVYWTVRSNYLPLSQAPANTNDEMSQSYSVSPKINEQQFIQYTITAASGAQPGWNYQMAVICYDSQKPSEILHVVTSEGRVPSNKTFTMASPANFAAACTCKVISVIHAWN